MRRAALIAASFALALGMRAAGTSAQQSPPAVQALPPETRTSVGDLQAMSPPERAAYLAGVADGMGVAHLRGPTVAARLGTCLRGFTAVQLADAYARQRAGGPVARLADSDSAALQFMLAMIGECQLQISR